MNMDSFDMILTIAALVMGVMLLTGHGDVQNEMYTKRDALKNTMTKKKFQLVSFGVILLSSFGYASYRSGYGGNLKSCSMEESASTMLPGRLTSEETATPMQAPTDVSTCRWMQQQPYTALLIPMCRLFAFTN